VLTALAVAAQPLQLPHGPANIAPVDLLMLAALCACLLWAGDSRRKLRFPYAAPMAVFIACGALAAMIGPAPGDGLIAVAQDAWLLVWCWVVANVASSAGRLRTLLATWAYAAVAWASALFVGLVLGQAWLTGQTSSEGSRTALMFGDPSYAANYYVVSIMIIWASGFPRRRGIRLAAYGLLVAAIVSTGSNSGLIAVVVACIVAGVLGLYRRQGAIAAITAIACVALAGLIVATSVSFSTIQQKAHNSSLAFVRDGIGRSNVSASQRGSLRRETLPLYRQGGPLGQGPATTKERLRADEAPLVKEAHDDYAAALVERGALGFLALGALVIGLLIRAPELAVDRLGAGFAAVAARPHALVGALAGTLVAMTVYELLHLRHLWAFFAVLAALGIWGRK
jgi:O-antigen ligase